MGGEKTLLHHFFKIYNNKNRVQLFGKQGIIYINQKIYQIVIFFKFSIVTL